MRMEITGDRELIAKLKKLGASGQRQAEVAVRATAEKIMGDAKKSISRGEKTGRVYRRGGGQNLSSTHRASAPGEAPATDKGRLVGSGKADHQGLTSDVAFSAKYAAWLEFGTMRMAERPFLRPAIESNRDFFRTRLNIAIERAIQGAAK